VFFVVSAGTLKYSAVYGALGVLPLLMMWIYISWLIVLFGATYTFANQSVSTDSLDEVARDVRQSVREALAVRLATTITADFVAGRPPLGVDALAERVAAPLALVRRTLTLLVEHKLLVETNSDGDAGFVPARDPHAVTVGEVVEVLRHKAGAAPALGEGAALEVVHELLAKAEQAGAELLAGTSLRALAGHIEEAAARAAASAAPATGPSV
jgi:membrane protein